MYSPCGILKGMLYMIQTTSGLLYVLRPFLGLGNSNGILRIVLICVLEVPSAFVTGLFADVQPKDRKMSVTFAGGKARSRERGAVSIEKSSRCKHNANMYAYNFVSEKFVIDPRLEPLCCSVNWEYNSDKI